MNVVSTHDPLTRTSGWVFDPPIFGNIMKFLRKLHPVKLYSKPDVLCLMPRRRRRQPHPLNKVFSELPGHDGVMNGSRAWFGYRFSAFCSSIKGGLPVVDQAVPVAFILEHFPHLAAKLAPYLHYRVSPENLHPFILGFDSWKPSFSRRDPYMPPPTAFIGRTGTMKNRLYQWVQ